MFLCIALQCSPQLLKLALSCKPTIKQPVLTTALKMADNNSRQLLETLANNPKVLEKLFEALLPTLTKQMRTSQGQEGNRSNGDNGSMVDHASNSNDNSRSNEANISSTNPPANSEANQQGEVAGNSGGNVEMKLTALAACYSNVYRQVTVMPVMLSAVLALAGLVTVITVIIQCCGLDYGSDNYYPYFPSPPTMATTLECSI